MLSINSIGTCNTKAKHIHAGQSEQITEVFCCRIHSLCFMNHKYYPNQFECAPNLPIAVSFAALWLALANSFRTCRIYWYRCSRAVPIHLSVRGQQHRVHVCSMLLLLNFVTKQPEWRECGDASKNQTNLNSAQSNPQIRSCLRVFVCIFLVFFWLNKLYICQIHNTLCINDFFVKWLEAKRRWCDRDESMKNNQRKGPFPWNRWPFLVRISCKLARWNNSSVVCPNGSRSEFTGDDWLE